MSAHFDYDSECSQKITLKLKELFVSIARGTLFRPAFVQQRGM